MEELYIIIQCGVLYFFGVVSPGPSLLLVINNTLGLGKKSGVYTSLGIVLGIAIQTLLVLLFLDSSQKLQYFLETMRYMSAMFLFFIGAKNLLVQNKHVNNIKSQSKFYEGLLIEILNPFACIFFLSIFIPYLHNSTVSLKVFCLLEFISIGLIVFLSVVFLLNNASIKDKIIKKMVVIQKISGVVFIFFGIKMITEVLYVS
mgnify:CR=1 FL=1